MVLGTLGIITTATTVTAYADAPPIECTAAFGYGKSYTVVNENGVEVWKCTASEWPALGEGYWQVVIANEEGEYGVGSEEYVSSCVAVESVQEQEFYGLTSVNWTGTCETVPPGWIAVQNVMYYWTGSAWEECRASGWIYNSATTSKKSPISSDWSGSCGLGYYDTVAYGEMWTGSAWSGGGLASGYVYWGGATGAATPVGATRPAGTPPTPAPPLGVALPSNP